MKLGSLIGIENYKTISIVGAGGKTSFMMKLARELGENNKVLVTTTTKIYVPNSKDYQQLGVGNPKTFIRDIYLKNGIFVFGNSINEENKLVGIDENDIYSLKEEFDYILIEADGSKKKPLKGWKENEPVVYSETDLTVGILDIQSLGLEINEHNIHRLDLFIKLTGAKINDKVSCEHLLEVVKNEEGLFKNAKGKKLLFINKVEGKPYEEAAKEFTNLLIKEGKNLEIIIIGSLNFQNYNFLSF